MRTARNSKTMHPPESARHDSAAPKQLSGHSTASATAVVETPSWVKRVRPQGIARVPTHAVRPVEERRSYARAKLTLPLRVKRIAGQREPGHHILRTTNISSSGVLFLYSECVEVGTPLEIEICLVDRPFGRGSVRMRTEAHVVRAEPASRPGWHTLALSFDDITFERDEPLPSRFEKR